MSTTKPKWKPKVNKFTFKKKNAGTSYPSKKCRRKRKRARKKRTTLSGWNVFIKERAKTEHDKNPSMHRRELLPRLSQVWHSLSAKNRRRYDAKAKYISHERAMSSTLRSKENPAVSRTSSRSKLKPTSDVHRHDNQLNRTKKSENAVSSDSDSVSSDSDSVSSDSDSISSDSDSISSDSNASIPSTDRLLRSADHPVLRRPNSKYLLRGTSPERKRRRLLPLSEIPPLVPNSDDGLTKAPNCSRELVLLSSDSSSGSPPHSASKLSLNSAPHTPSTSAVDRECTVCLSELSCIAVLNCGHLCLCSQCAKQFYPAVSPLADNANSCCPKCRLPIVKLQRIFV